jgi:hypothetical protein
MTVRMARHWLGIYFLVVTVFVGLFLLVFSGSSILPLTGDEAKSNFQVLVPVLAGQLAIVFRWWSNADVDGNQDDQPSPIPTWAIVLPPILALLVFVSGVVALENSTGANARLNLGPSGFQGVVTFTVTILNATTVLLISRLFPSLGGKNRTPPKQRRKPD